jgi:hypothetical protein
LNLAGEEDDIVRELFRRRGPKAHRAKKRGCAPKPLYRSCTFELLKARFEPLDVDEPHSVA